VSDYHSVPVGDPQESVEVALPKNRLLVIEVLNGAVVGVAFDTGEELDVSVAVVDHGDRRVYRMGEADSGGGEGIIASVKRGDCDEGIECGAHGYTDDDDEAVRA
jgi:hypothetical protein